MPNSILLEVGGLLPSCTISSFPFFTFRSSLFYRVFAKSDADTLLTFCFFNCECACPDGNSLVGQVHVLIVSQLFVISGILLLSLFLELCVFQEQQIENISMPITICFILLGRPVSQTSLCKS